MHSTVADHPRSVATIDRSRSVGSFHMSRTEHLAAAGYRWPTRSEVAGKPPPAPRPRETSPRRVRRDVRSTTSAKSRGDPSGSSDDPPRTLRALAERAGVPIAEAKAELHRLIREEYDRRKRAQSRAKRTAAGRPSACLNCHGPLPQRDPRLGGTARSTCSDRCRMALCRKRAREAA